MMKDTRLRVSFNAEEIFADLDALTDEMHLRYATAPRYELSRGFEVSADLVNDLRDKYLAHVREITEFDDSALD